MVELLIFYFIWDEKLLVGKCQGCIQVGRNHELDSVRRGIQLNGVGEYFIEVFW